MGEDKDIEYQYRRGYRHGYVKALEDFYELLCSSPEEEHPIHPIVHRDLIYTRLQKWATDHLREWQHGDCSKRILPPNPTEIKIEGKEERD